MVFFPLNKVLWYYKGIMRKKIFGLFLFFAPLCALAYTSVIAKPADQTVVLPLTSVQTPQELFGRLDGFPHTFEFTISEKFLFKATISVPDTAVQKNDISVIVVKKERRGVIETGRTLIKNQSWETSKDRMLVESFRLGGALEYTLEPGIYTLEMSSPNNEGKYRLELGTEKIHRGYFANLRVLFEVKVFLGNSKWSTILSPLVYVPLLIIAIGGFILHRKRKQKLLNTQNV